MGWLFVNIVLPTLAPLFLAFIFWFITRDKKLHPFVLVKDGQLAWTALAFRGTGLYETIDLHSDAAFVWTLRTAFIILILASSVVAIAGASKPLNLKAIPRPPPRAFGASVAVTFPSIVLAVATHFGVQ